MFKRGKVLKFFNPENSKSFSYDELYSLLKSFGLQNLKIRPQYSSEIKSKIFKNVVHGTLFCVTENVKREEEDFAFLCYPAQSKNINTTIIEGESIWYFEDKTFRDIDFKTIPAPKFYWLSTANMSFSPFANSKNKSIFKTSPSDISFLTNVFRLKTEIKPVNFYSDQKNLVVQNESKSFITIESENSLNKIKLFSGVENNLKNFLDTRDIDFDNVKSAMLVSETGISFYDNLYSETLSDIINYKNINGFLFNDKNTLSYSNENFLSESFASNSSDNLDVNTFKEINIFDYQNTPNISLKSNIVNIIAKSPISNFNNDVDLDEDVNRMLSEETNNISDDEFQEIRLLKNGSNLSNTSQILINNDSDIVFDARSIYAGNFNRHLLKHQILSEEEIFNALKSSRNLFDSLDEEKKQKVINMCGKGDSFLIGYEKSLSEPLVLGNTLMVLLKDMIDLTQLTIDQNRDLNDKVNSLAQEYSAHTHIVNAAPNSIPVIPPAPAPPVPIGFVGAVPPAALISVPTLESAYHQTFSSKDAASIDNQLSDIQAKLNDVKSNLKYMLSRFAKTSWCYIYLIKKK